MDSKWTEVFEDYLNNRLNEQERLALENEFNKDKDLEDSFKVFKAVTLDLGSSLKNKPKEDELRKTIASLNQQYVDDSIAVSRKSPKGIGRVLVLVASLAASLLLIFFVYDSYISVQSNVHNLALDYYNTDLSRLGQTMGSALDSLQLGISYYNTKNYSEAVLIFESLIDVDPTNSEARKNLGFSYLGLKDYDKALAQFDELSRMEQLFANPGLFYKALTFLLRDGPGDQDHAKVLLQKVIDEDQEGSRTAREWIKTMK